MLGLLPRKPTVRVLLLGLAAVQFEQHFQFHDDAVSIALVVQISHYVHRFFESNFVVYFLVEHLVDLRSTLILLLALDVHLEQAV